MLSSPNREKAIRLADVALRKERGTRALLTAFPTPFAMPDDSYRWNTHSQLIRGHIHEAAIHAATIPDAKQETSPSKLAIQQQLTRMLRSKIFIQSDKLSKFLRFVVEHVIEGNATCLKEYVIGAEVYDRRPPYHPSQDSIVRTEARRLRTKLKEYYEGEGQDDPVSVYLRPGSYVPVFQNKKDLVSSPATAKPLAFLPETSPSLSVAILPFSDISGNSISAKYARGIPDELAYALMTRNGCAVIATSCTLHCSDPDHSTRYPANDINKAKPNIAYEGSVRAEEKHLRVTARIIDAAGFQLWTKRIDIDLESENTFAIEAQIATVLSKGFDDLVSHLRRSKIQSSI